MFCVCSTLHFALAQNFSCLTWHSPHTLIALLSPSCYPELSPSFFPFCPLIFLSSLVLAFNVGIEMPEQQHCVHVWLLCARMAPHVHNDMVLTWGVLQYWAWDKFKWKPFSLPLFPHLLPSSPLLLPPPPLLCPPLLLSHSPPLSSFLYFLLPHEVCFFSPLFFSFLGKYMMCLHVDLFRHVKLFIIMFIYRFWYHLFGSCLSFDFYIKLFIFGCYHDKIHVYCKNCNFTH